MYIYPSSKPSSPLAIDRKLGRKEMAAPLAIACTVLLLPVFISTGLAAGSSPPPVIFAFGDSLSDVGNNNYLPLSLAKSNYPWYGIDYYGGLPTGRYTNGRTIGDIMSAKLGAPSPLPYLSLSMSDDAILRGVNYASGGAGILNETGLYFVQKLSFDDQIGCFEKTTVAIASKIGKLASQELLNDALYFIGLGSNDYINNFLQAVLADGYIFTEQEFVQLLMATLEDQLTRLYELGARKVVFDGLGPMGCIPSQRAKSDDGQCLEYVNQYALNFNSRLKKLLAQLNLKLLGANMSLSDIYNIVLDLINDPKKYGFKVSHEPCCNVDTGVGGLCLPNSSLCPNRKDYVFWDAYHPTDAANQVIVDIIFGDLAATFHQHPPPPPAATPGFGRTAPPPLPASSPSPL